MKQFIAFFCFLLIAGSIFATSTLDRHLSTVHAGPSFAQRDEKWLDSLIICGIFAVFGAMTKVVVSHKPQDSGRPSKDE